MTFGLCEEKTHGETGVRPTPTPHVNVQKQRVGVRGAIGIGPKDLRLPEVKLGKS